MDKIELEAMFQRDPQLVSTIMDGDTVMMDVERGEYYGLGGVGSRIWELLENPVSVQQLIQTLCAEFEVDEDSCRADLGGFLSALEEKAVVHRVN